MFAGSIFSQFSSLPKPFSASTLMLRSKVWRFFTSFTSSEPSIKRRIVIKASSGVMGHS